MAQTITSIAALGSRYLSGIQYRVLDTAGAYYPGPDDNLANGTHLGQGIWRAVVTLPDAGGEVRWSQAGALLAVDVVEPLAGLSGAQAASLAATEALIRALVLGGFEIDYANSVAIQRNPDGTERVRFDLKDDNNDPASTPQTAVKRVPQ